MAEYRQTEYGPRDPKQARPNIPNPVLWECVVTRLANGKPNCHHKELQPDGTFKEYDHEPHDDKLRALQDREWEEDRNNKKQRLAALIATMFNPGRTALTLMMELYEER